MTARRLPVTRLGDLVLNAYLESHRLHVPDFQGPPDPNPNQEHFDWHIGIDGPVDMFSTPSTMATAWQDQRGYGPNGVEWWREDADDDNLRPCDYGRNFLAFHRSFIRKLEDFLGRPAGDSGYAARWACVPVPVVDTSRSDLPTQLTPGTRNPRPDRAQRPGWAQDRRPSSTYTGYGRKGTEFFQEEYPGRVWDRTSLRQIRSSNELGLRIALDPRMGQFPWAPAERDGFVSWHSAGHMALSGARPGRIEEMAEAAGWRPYAPIATTPGFRGGEGVPMADIRLVIVAPVFYCWHGLIDEVWKDWERIALPPIAVFALRLGPGWDAADARVYLAARDKEGRLHHNYWSGDSFRDWREADDSPRVHSEPAAVQWGDPDGDYRTRIFLRDDDNSLRCWRRTGDGWEWSSAGTASAGFDHNFAGPLLAVQYGELDRVDGRRGLHVFGRSPEDDRMAHGVLPPEGPWSWQIEPAGMWPRVPKDVRIVGFPHGSIRGSGPDGPKIRDRVKIRLFYPTSNSVFASCVYDVESGEVQANERPFEVGGQTPSVIVFGDVFDPSGADLRYWLFCRGLSGRLYRSAFDGESEGPWVSFRAKDWIGREVGVFPRDEIAFCVVGDTSSTALPHTFRVFGAYADVSGTLRVLQFDGDDWTVETPVSPVNDGILRPYQRIPVLGRPSVHVLGAETRGARLRLHLFMRGVPNGEPYAAPLVHLWREIEESTGAWGPWQATRIDVPAPGREKILDRGERWPYGGVVADPQVLVLGGASADPRFLLLARTGDYRIWSGYGTEESEWQWERVGGTDGPIFPA